MRKILFLAICALLISVQSWGATVYTKGIDGTVYYDSGASSCAGVTGADTASDLEGALTAAGADGTVYICAGTYSGTMLDSADGLNTVTTGQTIIGVGEVVIDGETADDDVLLTTHTGTTINNITFQDPNTGKAMFRAYSGTNITINDCIFDFGRNSSLAPGSSLSNTSTTFNRCEFKNFYKLGAYFPFQFNNASTDVVFSFCKFINNSRSVQLRNGTLEINNCIFDGSDSMAVHLYANSDTKVLTINNSTFTAAAYADNVDPIVNASTGNETLTLNNNIITGSRKDPQVYYGVTGDYDGTNNIGLVEENSFPVFTSSRYPAFIYLMIDDWANLTSAQTLASKAEAYGWRMTYVVDTAAVTDWSALQALVDAGHTIAGHTRHHANMVDLSAFQVQYAGAAGTCTMTIDVAGDSLTTSEGLSLTLSNYSNVGALSDAIDAEEDYTCESEDMTPDVTYAQVGMTNTLADVTAQDIKTDVYLSEYDQTLFFAEEIDGCYSDLQNNLTGFTPKTFVFPGHYQNEAAQDAVKDAGFYAAGAGDDYRLLSSITIFNMDRRSVSAIFTDIYHDLAAYVTYFGFIGAAQGYYSHRISDWGESNWDSFLLALSKSNASVVTFDYVADWIRANGTPDGDGEVYTVDLASVWGDQSDYSLKSDSIAWNAGTEAATAGFTGSIEDGLGITRTFPGLYNLNIGIDQTKLHSPSIIGGKILGGTIIGN